MADHYYLIIIGIGARGRTLAHQMAPSGKKILLLEGGSFLPKERENWDTIGDSTGLHAVQRASPSVPAGLG